MGASDGLGIYVDNIELRNKCDVSNDNAYSGTLGQCEGGYGTNLVKNGDFEMPVCPSD